MKSLVFFILCCDVTCDCSLSSMYPEILPFGNLLLQKVKVLGIPDINSTTVFGDRMSNES